MVKDVTIVEAIKIVLKDNKHGLSYPEIYKRIVEKNLYSFGAKDPKGIVRAKLRQHCYGIEYPSASPTKHFISDGGKGSKSLYRIWDGVEFPSSTQRAISGNEVPEESIEKHHKIHVDSVKNQIMDGIYNSDPGFFEKLVMKLLLAMGYGWDNEKSATHVGGPNDKGIDGIIYQDQLGLEKVYIQAKRYAKDNKVTQSEIQKFIGAINTAGADKGVFITSSSFTRGVQEQALNARNMTVILIDGERLSQLLLQNELGVSTAAVYKTFAIDSDAFKDS